MHYQYYISQDLPRTCQAINEVVHAQNLHCHEDPVCPVDIVLAAGVLQILSPPHFPMRCSNLSRCHGAVRDYFQLKSPVRPLQVLCGFPNKEDT
jgi:hypothetical protein